MVIQDMTSMLEDRRRELGMTMVALAKRAGLSRQTVIRMLQDHASDCSFRNLLAVAEVLGVAVEFHATPLTNSRIELLRPRQNLLYALLKATWCWSRRRLILTQSRIESMKRRIE